jgi:hypothetical protein
MTMRIRFLKNWRQPYGGDSYGPGDTAFMTRPTAEILCRYGIAEIFEVKRPILI